MPEPIYTLAPEAIRRTAAVVRRVERESVQTDGQQPEYDLPSTGLEQFVIASDVSQYVPSVSSIPQGYDSFAVAYRIQPGCDLAKLPRVPDIATLIYSNSQVTGSAPRGAALDWSAYKWVGDYSDASYGRPLLINLNRLFRGYAFRGEVVAAMQLPANLHGFAGGGTTFYPWAPSAANLDRISPAVQTAYDLGTGWCAIGTGHLVLDVELASAVLRPSSVTYNQATVRHLRDPKPADGTAGTFKIWFACAETPQPPMPAGQQFKVTWNQAMYRWELIPTGASILVKPAADIAKGASGTCNIYAGTQGSEIVTGDTLTAYARAAAIASTKWGYAALVNGRMEVAQADC